MILDYRSILIGVVVGIALNMMKLGVLALIVIGLYVIYISFHVLAKTFAS